MCGITGFISKKRVSDDVLMAMNATIAYRGPDSQGQFLAEYSDRYQIGLAHQRLAIIDLSAQGHQPMFSDDQNIVVVYNGEIYNFYKIKAELEQKKHVFKSHSDTEVIIKAYQEWGIACVDKFNGMFAIALYDKRSGDFFLIRDRLGVKPLYYYLSDKGLIFGSELKPIMAHPDFRKELDPDALALYLFHGYITAPNSIFKNTYKLEPGKILKFNNGKIKLSTYWSIEQKFQQRQIIEQSEAEWVQELDDLLTDSISDRMISDVPLGAFLSGGIDSSLIVALMQKISDRPVKTFTIGFEESQYNEALHAKRVAEHLGTEHHELYLPIKAAEELIPNISQFYDEPFADSSQLPTMLVSKLAREHVTVALSGDGGDELFCGYGRYETILDLKKLMKYSRLAGHIPFFKNSIKMLTQNSKYLQFFEITNADNIINSAYLSYLNNYNLLKHHRSQFESKYQQIMENTSNMQEKHMLQDMVTYLPDDILTKVDRASMSVSLESRPPLLDDHRLLEFSFRLPHEYKYRKGTTKYLLKEVLYKYVPKEMLERPKMGFGVPIYDWLRSDLRYLVEQYLSREYIEKQNLFNWSEISKLKIIFFEEKSFGVFPAKLVNKFKLYKDGYVDRTIWHLLVFQLWHERYF